MLVGASATTHYWFPGHLARSSLGNPEEIIVSAQNCDDTPAVKQGNVTEFLVSQIGDRSWRPLLENGPPEYANVGRAHEDGLHRPRPDWAGRDGGGRV